MLLQLYQPPFLLLYSGILAVLVLGFKPLVFGA